MAAADSRGRRRLMAARLLVALLLLSFLVWLVGIGPLLASLVTVDIGLAAVTALLLMVLFVGGAGNLWLLLRTLEPLPFPAFLRAYLRSWAASLLTPGQFGDATIALFLRRYRISLSRSGTVYLVDKLISLVVLLLICSCGVTPLLPDLHPAWFWLLPVTVLTGGSLALALLRRWRTQIGIVCRLQRLLGNCLLELKSLRSHWPIVLLNVGLTIGKWGVLSITYMVVFLAYGARVPWPEIGIIPLLSTLVGYIPISVSGIGTVEVTAVYLFGRLGVPQATVVSAYVLLRLLQYLMAGVMIALDSSGPATAAEATKEHPHERN